MISPGNIRSISEKPALQAAGGERVGDLFRNPLIFGT
jgi:hypothetical protein